MSSPVTGEVIKGPKGKENLRICEQKSMMRIGYDYG